MSSQVVLLPRTMPGCLWTIYNQQIKELTARHAFGDAGMERLYVIEWSTVHFGRVLAVFEGGRKSLNISVSSVMSTKEMRKAKLTARMLGRPRTLHGRERLLCCL